MNVLKNLAVSAVLILGLAGAAMAQPGGEGNNTGCNGQGNPNSPCQGNGGAGGAGGAGGDGGTGIGIGVGVAKQHQHQQQTQTSVNVNDNRSSARSSSKASVKDSANNQNTVTVEGDKTEIPAQAPAVFAPNLTSSPEACMGSVSAGGGAGFGGTSFGITFGTTWTNEQCQDRMNAREIRAGGDPQAAREYLAASNPKIAEAYKRAGVKVAVNEPVVVGAAVVIPDTTLKLNTPLGTPSSTYHAPLTVQEVAKRGEAAPSPCGVGNHVTPSGFCRTGSK